MLAKDYCKVNGHNIVGQIVEKMSGAKSDRDGLKELMQLTKKDCDLVVVSELSRISREEEFQRIFARIDTLRDAGIGVVFLDDPEVIYSNENPITFTQFIILGVKAQGAREELLKIRDRMKSGRLSKVKSNAYMVVGSKIPFGFEKYDNPHFVLGQTPKSLIRVNEDEAAILRRCYEMAITGQSCQQIADFLNHSGYIHKHQSSKGEKLWAATEVNRLLKNRLYVGEREVMGVCHKIEAIVSEDMYDAAVKCIAQKRCNVSKTHFNPLKGLFVCGHCGLPMTLIEKRGNMVYVCLNDHYQRKMPNREIPECNNAQISYNSVTEAVWNLTKDRIENGAYYGKSQLAVADYYKQIQSIEKHMSKMIQERRPIRREMEKRLKQIESLTDPDIIEVLQESYQSMKEKALSIEDKIRDMQKERDRIVMKKSEILNDITINDDMTVYEKAVFFNKVISQIRWIGEKYHRNGIIQIDYKNGDSGEIAVKTK